MLNTDQTAFATLIGGNSTDIKMNLQEGKDGTPVHRLSIEVYLEEYEDMPLGISESTFLNVLDEVVGVMRDIPNYQSISIENLDIDDHDTATDFYTYVQKVTQEKSDETPTLSHRTLNLAPNGWSSEVTVTFGSGLSFIDAQEALLRLAPLVGKGTEAFALDQYEFETAEVGQRPYFWE